MLIEESRKKISLFPTILYQFKIDDYLIDELKEIILNEYKEWGSSKYISVSPDNQHKRDFNCIKEISKILDTEVLAILENMKVMRVSHYISGMWHNVSREPYQHQQHTHPNSFLSGIIYVNCPGGCGNTVFTDPVSERKVFLPDLFDMNQENARTFSIKPEKGLVTIFPSWLNHQVNNGTMKSTDLRISTAFNYNLHGKANQLNTARLEY